MDMQHLWDLTEQQADDLLAPHPPDVRARARGCPVVQRAIEGINMALCASDVVRMDACCAVYLRALENHLACCEFLFELVS